MLGLGMGLHKSINPIYKKVIAYKDGTIYVEPYIKDKFLYNNGITFSYPVSAIDKALNKDNIEVTATLAGDGLSATITGGVNGQYYTIYAPIKPEYSTIPTTAIQYRTNLGVYSEAIYNTASIFSVGLGTDSSGNPLDYVSSIVNGQVSVVAKGNTRTNLFNKDSYTQLSAYLAAAVTTASGYSTLYMPIKKSTTYTVSRFVLGERFSIGFTAQLPANGVAVTGIVAGNTSSSLTSTSAADSLYIVVYYYNSSVDTKTEAAIRNAIQIEEGSVANSYISYGTKSTASVKLVSVTKNLVPDDNYLLGYYNASLVFTSSGTYRTFTTKKLKAGTYSISSDKALNISFRNTVTASAPTVSNSGNTPCTVTITEEGYYYVGIRNSGGTTWAYGTKPSDDKVMANGGSVALPYVPFQQNTLYLPTIGQSVGSVKDEVSVVGGKATKTKRVSDPYTLLGSDIVAIENLASVQIAYTATNRFSDGSILAPATLGTLNVEGMSPSSVQDPSTLQAVDIGKYYISSTKRLGFVFTPNTYANLTSAQSAIAGKVVTYQLATVIITQVTVS